MKVKFKKLHPDAVIPTQSHSESGGWDVYCTGVDQIEKDFVICKLGFSLEVPIGWKVTLVPRSSLTSTHWLLQNSPGLGDSNYRGEYQYRFRALPINWRSGLAGYSEDRLIYPEFPYKVGDRIGQIYLEEVVSIEFEEVAELADSDRGVNGYGSTGV